MKRKKGFLSALILTISLTLGAQNAYAALVEKWGNGDTLTLTDQTKYFMLNNMWGKGTITNYQQSIFGDGPKTTNFGWKWNWPSGVNNDVKSYPEVKVNSDSQPSKLPTQISANKNIWMEWNFNLKGFDNTGSPTGRFDCAWDIWLNPTSGEKVYHDYEIMIWPYANGGATPLGSKIASAVSLGGSTWDVYSGTVNSTVRADSWTCITFKRTTNTTSINFNLKTFFDWLRNNGKITSSAWLHSIEAGTEVVDGVGRLNTTFYKSDVD